MYACVNSELWDETILSWSAAERRYNIVRATVGVSPVSSESQPRHRGSRRAAVRGASLARAMRLC